MRIAIISGENYGTNYFRGALVKRAIDRWGARAGVEAMFCSAFPTNLLEPSAGIDVFYFLRPTFDHPIDLLHRIKRAGKPLVIDYDDDLFNVPAWSPAAQTFEIGSVRSYYKHALAAADLVTTTTKAASRIVGSYSGAESRVIPNAFDREHKLFRPMPQWVDGGTPNIGWSGGSQHSEDLKALEPVFMECLRRGYGLTFVGDGPRFLRGMSPKHRVAWVPGNHNVEMYQQHMPLAGFDVGLAPVLDIPFNHSKSALKFAEYSWLCGVPAVVSDIPCYAEVVPDGKRAFKVKGWEVSSWMDAIEAGIETTKEEGRRYILHGQYDLENTWKQWVGAFADAYRIVRGADPLCRAAAAGFVNETAPVGA